jgi:hypothetical protein
MGRDGREILERFDGVLTPVGVARSQCRLEELLKQRRFAVG